MARKAVLEDETKNVLKLRYFADYDWTPVIGKIDLCVRSQPVLGAVPVNYLWAETKQGKKKDIYESFIQLILTIGKGRTYEDEMPPYFLGAADAEKIAFVEYNKIMHIFTKNDFNWNVTPSDHTTKEFRELYGLLHDALSSDVSIFKYAYDDKALRSFIRKNFKEGRKDMKKQSVGKNNFTFVYFDWVRSVKDSIAVDWGAMEKIGVYDRDFFLADLMSKDGMSIKDKLKVVLEKTKYKVLVKANLGGFFDEAFTEFTFRDGQKAYDRFWNRYERPPKKIYQNYILERNDLLVPQDIREIKGSYYTPEQWVRLSQEYLAKTLGEDWQEEYYVWDCAAGTGNLLRGLTNKYNIYASTLDDSDVKVMHDAIDGGRLNLVKGNVFQFDFLNDGYKKAADGNWVSDLENCEKIPESLRKIIADPEKRKKLVIYINPPYAEVSTKDVTSTGRKRKAGVNKSLVHTLYGEQLGVAGRELYILFLTRIYNEIPSSRLAEFSTLKILQGAAFSGFREHFKASLRGLFVVPADTFDNVRGQFPIGFFVWDTERVETFTFVDADVYDATGAQLENKRFFAPAPEHYINKWISSFKVDEGPRTIGFLDGTNGNDFQHNNIVYITLSKHDLPNPRGIWLDRTNLIPACVYFAVRKCVAATWLNDRDQFLAPNDSWAGDLTFQVDCLVWSIFNNAVREENGVCHWIPFYEDEVNAPASFNSRFMADFLRGKIIRKKQEGLGDLFTQMKAEQAASITPLEALSEEAMTVLAAGREVWRYYMSNPGISVNASFLDIRAYFQGYKVTEKGKRVMNSSSTDQEYMRLWSLLKDAVKALEARIEPKVYEHGFLLK